jgi:hypothetical protein
VKLKISVYKSIAIANKEVPKIIYLQIKLFICTTITGDADKEDKRQHYTQTAGGLMLALQSRYGKVIGKFSASLNYYYL